MDADGYKLGGWDRKYLDKMHKEPTTDKLLILNLNL